MSSPSEFLPLIGWMHSEEFNGFRAGGKDYPANGRTQEMVLAEIESAPRAPGQYLWIEAY